MNNQELASLNEQVDALMSASQAERIALRKSSRVTGILSAMMLTIVSVFVAVNYSRMQRDWTEEKLGEGFQKELAELQPVALASIQRLGQQLAPVYVQVGRDQFTKMAPELSRRANNELNALGRHIRSDSESRLGQITDRLSTHAEDITFAAYPGLRSPAEQAKLTMAFRESTESAVNSATQQFGLLFASDVHALEAQIRGFRAERSELPTIELEKRFIQLWLHLLDAEIASK